MVLIGMKDYEQALTVCQVAMEQDTEKKHTREIETQMQKAIMETQTQRQGETDEQTLERAMKNPEIAQIMVSQEYLPPVSAHPTSEVLDAYFQLPELYIERPRHAIYPPIRSAGPQESARPHEKVSHDQGKD